jgi:hypothetical protein
LRPLEILFQQNIAGQQPRIIILMRLDHPETEMQLGSGDHRHSRATGWRKHRDQRSASPGLICQSTARCLAEGRVSSTGFGG